MNIKIYSPNETFLSHDFPKPIRKKICDLMNNPGKAYESMGWFTLNSELLPILLRTGTKKMKRN